MRAITSTACASVAAITFVGMVHAGFAVTGTWDDKPMKRTVYTVQCAMPNGTVTSFTRYAWNAARRSIVETLRATGQAWEKIDSNYEKVGSSHAHGSEVWQNDNGEKVRFVINKS